jgi:hypothetical protein
MVAKRWNYSFQLTNRSKDETYTNTELSLWQFNTKLKYLLSNSVNFQAYYYYVDKEQGLNGGVDYDSLSRSSDDPNADLYDPIAAPVFSPNQKLDVLQHNVGLRAFAKPFDNSLLDLSIYYRYGLDELNDSQDSLKVFKSVQDKSYGGVLNFFYTYDFLTLNLFGNYENSDFIFTGFRPGLQNNNSYEEFYNYGGIITLRPLNKMVELSFYYKNGFKSQSDFSYNGIGADLNFNLWNQFDLYAGYSLRQADLPEDYTPTIEGGISYHNLNLTLNLKYFNTKYVVLVQFNGDPGYYGDHLFYTEGAGLIFNYKFWILLLETNTSYYFKIEDDNGTESGLEKANSLPDWQFIGGLYASDFFFNENLNLKAGFKFSYIGKINTTIHYYWGNDVTVEPTNKLDFNLAGEIQKVAIFYFQWENLFGNEYYITPYYPMPVRNIKFGIAWELFN